MFWIKYAVVAFLLATWCNCSPIGGDSDSNQGEREKRTLILGLLFKKLLLQQVVGRSLSPNGTTTAAPPAMMNPRGSAPANPPAAPPLEGSEGSNQGPSQEQPPPSGPPPQAPTAPEMPTAPMGQPPQGFLPSQVLPPFQGFPVVQRIPTSLGLPGQSLTVFNSIQPPINQKLSFPLNFPFGIQGFRQLPFGPAPPLGAQAGPQGNPRITSSFPFGIQNGIVPQQGSPFAQTGPFGSEAESQLPPTGSRGDLTQQSAQGPPLPPSGADGSQGPPPPESNPQQSGPETDGPQGPPPPTEDGSQSAQQDFSIGSSSQLGPEGNGGQGLQPNFPFGPVPSAQPPQSGPQGLAQNFQFGPGPSAPPPQPGSGGEGSQGLPPNFSFEPSGPPPTGPGADNNGQGASGDQSEPAGNGLPSNFQFGGPLDNNLRQQFGPQPPEQPPSGGSDQPPNGFPSNLGDLPPNFQLPNGEPQPDQSGNGLFDPRQFAGSDNNVFDFAQQGAPQTSDNDRSQPQPQPGPFQDGLFSASEEQQFNGANNPQSNFAFNDQQFGLTSLFQDGSNFRSNLFQ